MPPELAGMGGVGEQKFTDEKGNPIIDEEGGAVI